MLTLLIEASTERGMIAILDKENILFHEELPFGYNNSKYLLPTIEKALHVTNLSVKQLSTIAVGIGPGSYTGIRIAAATAKALSYACKIPLVGICTLEGFVPNRDGSFATIIDAKISGTYLIKGYKKGVNIEYSTPPIACPLDQLNDQLHDVEMLITPNATVLRKKIEIILPLSVWEWQEISPNPNHMGRIAAKHLDANHYSLDGRLELLYLRRTQAEIEKGSVEEGLRNSKKAGF